MSFPSPLFVGSIHGAVTPVTPQLRVSRRMLARKQKKKCLSMVFLFIARASSKTSKVSQYQLVSHFTPSTEGTIAVEGDTDNGCKYVLLDR